MLIKRLRLKNKADRRLKLGHLWIFSNEVDTKTSPLKSFELGEQVLVENTSGKVLGIAYVNPNSLICARLISRDSEQMLDKSLLVYRINIALSMRERLFEKPFYRLIYGDSDGLPGLVVDRFEDYLVAQISTAGMEKVRELVIGALHQVLNPKGILLKNIGNGRKLEDLSQYMEVVSGDVPDMVILEENGVSFQVPIVKGQKTGWFYDHRMNRNRLRPYVKGKRVLDVFSYIGGWGIQAAVFGADNITCLDASAFALNNVHANAELNNVQGRVDTIKGDAFEALKALKRSEERFDVIIVDPPAFIKNRKDIKVGEHAYRRINELAMKLLDKDGYLISASCSMHLQRENMVDLLHAGSRHIDRNLQILEQGHQGPDHPVHPAIPETDYIKAIFTRFHTVDRFQAGVTMRENSDNREF